MTTAACKSTCRGVPCQLLEGHADQHRNGIHRWIVSDSTIAEAEAMAQQDLERRMAEESTHKHVVEILAMRMSLCRFSDEESDRMIELTMREAGALAEHLYETVESLIAARIKAARS